MPTPLGAATNVIYPAEGYHTEDVAEGTRIAHSNISLVAIADMPGQYRFE